MSSAEKIPYYKALAVAKSLINKLEVYCDRIEIAGSIRRNQSLVGDIELVLIPTWKTDLDGEVSYSTYLVESKLNLMGCKFKKNGDKYKQVELPNGIIADLFITTPEKWGCIFTIRTGSDLFAKRLVTQKWKGGLCPNSMHFREGRIVENDILLDTPEEIDVFKALGLDYIEPELRDK